MIASAIFAPKGKESKHPIIVFKTGFKSGIKYQQIIMIKILV